MTRREPIDDALQQRTAVPSPATKPYFANRPWLLALVLVVVTFVAYQPAWHAGFIWDDDRLITDNRMVQARDGLYRIWFTTEAADYYPLTSSFWWLQWRLWGKNAGGYHAVNIFLHAANVVLIWMLLRCLRVPGAWLAALLFAVHPVNVATVAWISEQKNTLSMLFFTLSILWYVRFDEESKRSWYGLSLAAFLLALLSKSAVVMLPVALLGCVWWLRGRVRWQDLLRSVPFFVLSLAMGLVTIWFQYNRVLGGHATRTDGFLSHLAVAGLAPWFYLYKTILPLNLCMVYPQWNPGAWGWSGWLPGIALAGSFALLWWKRNGWSRPLLFGLGYFVVMLFPVLGFFDQGFYQYSLVADHWQYYSIVGVTALAAAGIVALGTRYHREQQVIGSVAAVVVIVLGALSWQRCLVFRTQETLFRHNLLYNPLAWVAHYNLGVALAQAGRVEEAIGHYEQAVRIKPDYVEAHNNLGSALLQLGRVQGAIEEYEQALQLKPDFANAHYNLGEVLAKVGRIEEAIAHYEQALRIIPDDAEAHNNLGDCLSRLGKVQEAIGHYEQAVRIKPDYAGAQYNLGVALVRLGKVQEATAHYEQALRIKPDSVQAHYNLGNALKRLGRIPDAIAHYEQALRIEPDFAEAHCNLGNALKQEGKIEEAIAHYEQALRIKPDFAEAQYNLGVALARLGRLSEAVGHWEQALRLKPDYAEAHNDLGLALVRLGRLPEAMGHWEQALRAKPDYPEAQNNLAWLLATRTPADGGDPVRAVTLAERACELTNNLVAAYFDTLAAAYAATGRFNDAITTAQKAIGLASSAGQIQMLREIELHLELYRAGRPYRESATVTSPHRP